MESIGEKLRATRDGKSLSIDQVARDTNIAKRYIVALESEAFSEFPGEPYLIGFLRNYSDYLGLDAEEIVGLYKNFKIQEQPVPMEELLEQKRPSKSPLIILIVVVVAVLAAIGIIFGPQFLSRGGKSAAPAAKVAASGGTVYRLTDEIIERRFVAGDTVVVPVGKRSYNVKLSVSGRDLVLSDAAGTQTLKLGEEKSIDLNGDGTPDLKVFLRDIDTQDPAKGIVVRFDRFTQSPKAAASAPATTPAAKGAAAKSTSAATTPAAAAQTTAPAQSAAAPAQSAAAPTPSTPPAQPQTPQPATNQAQAAQPQASSPQTTPSNPTTVATISPEATPTAGPAVITQDPNASPFTINVDFTGNCLFRYRIDGKGEDQRFYQKGESTRLDVKQNIEIWASNGGALNLSISGNTVDMGTPGQVIARKIAWVKDNSTGNYSLEMTRLQ